MSKMAISIAVTSVFSNHPRISLNAAILLCVPPGFPVLQELTPTCLQQSVPGVAAALHSPASGEQLGSIGRNRDLSAQED